MLEVDISDPNLLTTIAKSLENLAVAKPQVNNETGLITLPLSGRARVLAEAINILDQLGVNISEITLRKPTLDDVFLTLTGHTTGPFSTTTPTQIENEEVLWQRRENE